MKSMIKIAVVAFVVMVVVSQLSKRVGLIKSLVPYQPAL